MNFIIYLVFFTLIQKQENTIAGTYRIEFEEEYKSQDGIIIFSSDCYERIPSNSKKLTGKIKYSNLLISLIDDDGNLQMNFLKRDIAKDTIVFGTKMQKNVGQGLVLMKGKLIRENK